MDSSDIFKVRLQATVSRHVRVELRKIALEQGVDLGTIIEQLLAIAKDRGNEVKEYKM